jgi:predicted MFS family arabinose efflux permease
MSAAPPRPTPILPLLAAVMLIGSVASNGSRIAIPLFALRLGASSFQVGAILAAYAFVPALCAIQIGRAVDRLGPRLPLLVASVGLAIGLSVPRLFPGLWSLALCAAVVGVCMSAVYISLQHTAGALGSVKTRTGNFTLLTIAQSAATLLSPPLTGLLIDRLGHREAFGALALVALVLIAALVAIGGRLPPPAHGADGARRGVVDLLRDRGVRSAMTIATLAPLGWELLFFFIPLHGARLGLAASTIGLIFSCFSLSVIGIRLAVPWLSRRAGEWALIAVALGTAGCIFLIMPLTGNAVAMMVLCVVLGSGMGISQPITMSIVYAASPAGRQAEVFGMRTTIMNTVQTASPLVLGTLSVSLGLSAALWPFALILLGGASFALRHNAALARDAA